MDVKSIIRIGGRVKRINFRNVKWSDKRMPLAIWDIIAKARLLLRDGLAFSKTEGYVHQD